MKNIMQDDNYIINMDVGWMIKVKWDAYQL